MTGLAYLLLICALIGLLGGAATMVLSAVARRFPTTESIGDIAEAVVRPEPSDRVAAHATMLDAWRSAARTPGDAILIVAALGLGGVFILIIVRAFAPLILLGLAVWAALWVLKWLALHWPAQISNVVPSGSGGEPLGAAQFLHDVQDISAVGAALDRGDGYAGPLRYRPAGVSAVYQFSFERVGGNWRIYIDAQPSYGMRSNDLHSTHRLLDDGRYYICWTGALVTLASAIQVATLWADKTQTYIATGRSF